MALSVRSRQPRAATRQSGVPLQLPTYQFPAHPLNEKGRRALEVLPRNHNLNNLKDHLKAASIALSNNAADITERYHDKANAYQRRKARQALQESGNGDDEGERAIEEIREKVENLTEKMEEGLRKIIDSQATVNATETALLELHSNIAAGGGAVVPTQSTLGASQFRRRQQRRGGADIDEVDSDFEDEDTGKSSHETAGPSGLLKRKLEEHATRYDNLSLGARYANHNDYVGFKRLIHDAAHPGDDAPPMPHSSTWFLSESSQINAANPITRNTVARDKSADSDSDIEVASERISIQCPFTLRPMKDPVTSKNCPHSFEKSAVVEYISRSNVRVDGTNRRGMQGGERALRCPVAGCEVMLTIATLLPNHALQRRIQRIQALQRSHDRGDSDSDPDMSSPAKGTQRQQAEEIESGDDIDDKRWGRRRTMQQATRIKKEKVASSIGYGRSLGSREVSVVPATQLSDREEDDGEGRGTLRSSAMIVDLGDGEEDDDDDDDEEEMDEEDDD